MVDLLDDATFSSVSYLWTR